MKKWIKITTMSLLCFTGNVFANSTNLNFVLGPAFSQLTNKQTMSPVTGLTNSYVSHEPVQTDLFYGLGGEYDFDHLAGRPITLGLGLAFYHVNLGTISGVETPGINILPPPQDTLNYKMQAQSSTLLFEPKLIYTAYDWQPYVLTGIGYAWNRLSDFSESVVSGSLATPATSPYSNNTQGNIAFEAGLGVQYVLWETKNNQAVLIHTQYRYLNLGQSSLGTAAAQTTNQHLTVNTITNIIDLGITYRF